MPRIIVDAGELTGRLREGAEARILAGLPAGHAGGGRVVIDAVFVYYRIEPVLRDEETPAPNGEDAHPHDDATGHVERTHRDFGRWLPKSQGGTHETGC